MIFKDLKRPDRSARPVDPEEIFRRLPKLPHTPNDLWIGQGDALRSWHSKRKTADVLISLSTGAGKTLVGLLIAQSLVNEGLDNVVYVCSTIDLVNQSKREAEKLGLKTTERVRGGFSNDQFETGQSFLITTYQALFQSFSIFKTKYPPGAVIFDDAHVAERLLRDAFTITLRKNEAAASYTRICDLYVPIFKDAGRGASFADIVASRHQGILLAPPGSTLKVATQLIEILNEDPISKTNEFRYCWGNIKDYVQYCAVTFVPGAIEIAPPFLPTNSLPYFAREDVRRIYMSATLTSKSDLARAFGRIPTEIIEPKSDAGQGERLILLASFFKDGQVSEKILSKLLTKHKVLVAVPSYRAADKWKAFGSPPDPKSFSEELETFRKARSGFFIMVARFDGIDLPDDTCRVMVIDGLPAGASHLEQFQWDVLSMQNFHAARLANRLTQLFGRINRGRKDYGVFILNGKDVTSWIQRERNIALLPDLLQKQSLLGLSVQEQLKIKTPDEIVSTISNVLGRDADWLEYYSDSVEGLQVEEIESDRAKMLEEALTAGALAETSFASLLWDNDLASARRALEQSVEAVGRADQKLAGWYNAWIGMCFEAQGDMNAAAAEYKRAKTRLGRNAVFEKFEEATSATETEVFTTPVARKMVETLQIISDAGFAKSVRELRSGPRSLVTAGSSAPENEESVRLVGECLGFEATRPDNEFGKGPDVLWRDPAKKIHLAFELKTGKKSPATYDKDDIGQAHNHLQWLKDSYKDETCLGLVFLGPDGSISKAASPDPLMYLSSQDSVYDLSTLVAAALEDIRKQAPLGRQVRCIEFGERELLGMPDILKRLKARKLAP